MDKKQKEALVLALLEKGESYRNIAQKAKVSPNTIKAVSNRAGLDETTSLSSRAFELYVQQKTPVEVAIALNLEAKEAIRFHQEYIMLLGLTEFTKVYIHIKDNPWPYVNLARLVQNAGMGDGEVVELLRITNGYLPRVRLEYDRVKEEKNSLQAELNSWKAELNNIARTYQQFVDRNVALKKRENELRQTISKLEARERELQKTTTEFQQHRSMLMENTTDTANLNSEVKHEDIMSTNDVLIPPLDTAVNYNPNENEMFGYHFQAESSYEKVIFDTKDFF
ncbi:MAG: hypothetical protein WBV84_02410 [Nitrososphaeraceae archaeon]